MAFNSYVGRGTLKKAVANTAKASITTGSLGNVSAFSIDTSESTKEMRDYTTRGNNVATSQRRTDKQEVTFKLHDIIQTNLDLALSGATCALLLSGLNDVDTGHTVDVYLPNVQLGKAKKIDFIGDDFMGLEITGTILTPTTGSPVQITATTT